MHFLSEEEQAIGNRLELLWRGARETMREVSALARACAKHAGEEAQTSEVCRSQHMLLGRVADDLSGTLLLAAVGYEMQAVALAACAFEAGHLSAHIGSDTIRAQEWLAWKSEKRMRWRIDEIIEGALSNAGRYSPAAAKRQYIFYQGTCLAKHVNPLLQRSAPVADSELARHLITDPEVTPSATNRAFTGVYVAGVSALLAAEVYIRACRRDRTMLTHQAELLAPQWNLVAAAFEARRQANKKKRQRDA